MNPYSQPFEQALTIANARARDGQDSPVRLLAQAVNQTHAHLIEVQQRVMAQPAGALRDQRMQRLAAIQHRLVYMEALMNILGQQYAGVALYDAPVIQPQAPLPTWASLSGLLADGFVAERYSVAQILDMAVARPLFTGDYNQLWSAANVAIENLNLELEEDDADVGLGSFPAPPPGRMNVGEWDQIDFAEVATTGLSQGQQSSEQPEGSGNGVAYNAYNPSVIAKNANGAGLTKNGTPPWWFWAAGAGLAGLMVGLVIARHRQSE